MKLDRTNEDLEVDIETRRRKQRELMAQLVERMVRSRAQQLYDERGQGDGFALQDWVKAEAEILENSSLAPVYRRVKKSTPGASDRHGALGLAKGDSPSSESPA